MSELSLSERLGGCQRNTGSVLFFLVPDAGCCTPTASTLLQVGTLVAAQVNPCAALSFQGNSKKNEFSGCTQYWSFGMTADGPVVHTVHASCIVVSCVSRCKDISSDKKKLIKKTDGSLYKVLEQSAAVTAGGPVVKPCAQYWSFGMTADGPVVHTVHASCIAVSCVSRCKDISSDKKNRWQPVQST